MKTFVKTGIDIHTLSLIISECFQGLEWDTFSDSDWDLLVRMAQAQGVGPLLYRRLSGAGKFSTLPEAARNALRGMYAGTRMVNQAIFKELEILAHRFAQAEIPVVVLKGACFALTIYPDMALRPMGDLDVLVPASRLGEAAQIARSLGYVDTCPEASSGLTDLLNHEICLQKTGSQPITLELHHSLVADKSFIYAVPVEWFWEQTEPLDGRSQTRFEALRMLTPTAQVLYASAHAMLQHGGKNAPLRWFYDLDLLICSYSGRMDWDLLLSQAGKFEWSSALNAALAQTHACFGTPIPEDVLTALSNRTDRNWRLVAQKQIHPATHILEERQKLLSLNWYGRYRLLAALIAPDPAYMLWRYQLRSSWLLPPFYIYRWGGIFKDAVLTALHLMRRSRPTKVLESEGFPDGTV